MNTKQLIATWYGGLLATVMLGLAGRSTLEYMLGVAVVTGLFVYTFSAHPRANKRAVLLAVGGPILSLAVLATLAAVLNSRSSRPSRSEEVVRETQPERAVPRVTYRRIGDQSVPIGQLEVFDVGFEHGMVPVGDTQSVIGRITNHSDVTLTRLVLHLRLLTDRTVIDENDVAVGVSVPPGETRSFEGRVPLRPKSKDSGMSLGTFGSPAHRLEFDVVQAFGDESVPVDPLPQPEPGEVR